MGVAEIQSSIDNLNSQVRGLGNLKTDYQNMNNQINEAIKELSASYNSIIEAKNKLSQNYSSETANNKLKDLEEEANKINNLIKKLRDEILAESNRKISTINSTKQTLDSNLNMEFNGEYSDVANAVGLTPEKLVKGNTVLNVEGTAELGPITQIEYDECLELSQQILGENVSL